MISFAFGSLVSGGCAAFGSNLSRLPSFVQGERNRANIAGAEGFEPSHDGIKTRCLTAWLRPSRFGPVIGGEATCTPAITERPGQQHPVCGRALRPVPHAA